MPFRALSLWPSGQRADPAQGDEDVRAKVITAHDLERIADDPELQRIVEFAGALCEAPTSLVSIVERERQWFMARLGMPALETPRSTSFCAHAMSGDTIFEVRDATKDPRFADNPLVTGPDRIRFYAGAPLVSSEGAPLGALCVIDKVPRPEGLSALQRQGLEVLARAVMQRLTSERLTSTASAALSEADRKLLDLAEHLPVYAWSADADGIVEYVNSAFSDYVGTRDPSKLNFVALAHPDDCEEVIAARTKGRTQGEKWETRARIRGADGRYRWMMIRAWPVKDPGMDRVISWFGAAVDVEDITILSESRELLARELSHRIKNIFAVVSGLVNLRARGRSELKPFVSELTDVFHALGRAHDYVRPFEGRKGDSLIELLKDLLAPYRGADGLGISLNGQDARIGAKAATPLALVFHELATNSAKYGALTDDSGHISITLGRDEGMVVIDWLETFAHEAPVSSPDGFGSRLIRTSVEGQLGGQIERRFESGGMRIVLRLPQDSIAG